MNKTDYFQKILIVLQPIMEKDGLGLAKEHDFAIVLSDLYIPIMQGFDFK